MTDNYIDFITRVEGVLRKPEHTADELQEMFNNNLPHMQCKSFSKDYKELLTKIEQEGRVKTYKYMITFTIDPNKHKEITPTLEEQIEKYIEAQPKRSALKMTRFLYSKEHHKNGRSHYHAVCVTKKSLKKDRFTYYIQKYGTIDLSKTFNNDETIEEGINYISKESIPTEVTCFSEP